jgi:hypothetical protein
MQAAEERADTVRKSPPANEQFGEVVSGAGTLTGTQPGWDPYEVWRTRVKRSSIGTPQRGPSGVSARSATQAGTT